MIRVDLRRVPEGGHDYETVAQLRVADDGTYDIDDPQGQFPLGLHVLDFAAEHAGPPRQVRFEDDPGTWARNLDTLLRGGYLVPVIVHDDAPDGTGAADAQKGS